MNTKKKASRVLKEIFESDGFKEAFGDGIRGCLSGWWAVTVSLNSPQLMLNATAVLETLFIFVKSGNTRSDRLMQKCN